MQFSMEREQRRRLGWLAMGGRALTFPAAILAEKIAL